MLDTIPRFLAFGYNRFRQKPIRIGTPAGVIEISRTQGHTVRVDITTDGSRMADHVGRLVAHVHEENGTATIYLEHEEVAPT